MLNNPFCVAPPREVVEAARELTARIDSSDYLRGLFAEGKMMGVMIVEREINPSCPTRFGHLVLYAFSGTVNGTYHVEGFVPPIFDYSASDIEASSAEDSQRLQKWLFSNYIVYNAKGEKRSILDIFADRGLTPPGGTGDCAAPKLLQYAYLHGLKPLSWGEFWYGASPQREVRRSGAFYPSCAGKCGPLLTWMMQGLDVEPNPLESDLHWSYPEPVVVFEDSSLVVVEKPSGMLAVPGRYARESLQQWLSQRLGCEIFSCHRLDMDTSGLMVYAKSVEVQAAVQQQFEKREVAKRYIARLSPAVDPNAAELHPGDKGKISLPLSSDYYDRPRQMVDYESGKPAVTGYEVLFENSDGTFDVEFTPFTGRTHQLRVHAAYCCSGLDGAPDGVPGGSRGAKGLGRPIVGDRLYGGTPAPRLMLHASFLSLRHPLSAQRLTFSSNFSKSNELN